MTRFDGTLDFACAWGRWRIGQARNEPVLASSGERRCLDHRPRRRPAHDPLRGGSSTPRASPLRLVTDAGRPVDQEPGPVR